jgi:beta-galactosidase
MLSVQDAEVLYRYNDPFYQDYAAVTRRREGAGRVYYLGCGLDEDTAAGLTEVLLKEQGIPMVSSPEGVEIVTRGDVGQRVRMYLNHNGFPVLFNGIAMEPYGCRIEVL